MHAWYAYVLVYLHAVMSILVIVVLGIPAHDNSVISRMHVFRNRVN